MNSEGSCQPVGTVVIIGGGASGVLAATHLLGTTERPVEVVVLEPSGLLAAGVAYGTTQPLHLLNAPTCEMSAWSRRPEDFGEYLDERGLIGEGRGYAPRSVYREYLLDCLGRARRSAHPMSGLEVRSEEAVALVPSSSRAKPGRVLVGLRHGAHVEADHVVLAIGAPPSVAPWTRLPSPVVGRGLVENPWSRAALDEIGREDRVLLVGSGLTAIDMLLTLRARGHRGRLFIRSRHGLLPERQLDVPTPPRLLGFDPSAGSARELVAAVRVAAEKAEFEGDDWRSVVAGVRSELPVLWRRLDERERSRLLRHVARYWEVHRHRMAPAVEEAVDQLRCTGQLDVALGHLVGLSPNSGSYRVQLEHARSEEQLTVDAIVNCTGPSSDYRKSRLVDDLLDSGLAAEDPLGIGLLLDECGDLLGVDGSPDHRLHTLGWLRRAQDYESTAIPEIRAQSEALAARIGSVR